MREPEPPRMWIGPTGQFDGLGRRALESGEARLGTISPECVAVVATVDQGNHVHISVTLGVGQ